MIDLNDFEAVGEIKLTRISPERIAIRKIRRRLQAHKMDGTTPSNADKAFMGVTLALIHGELKRRIEERKHKQEQAA